MSVLEKLHIGVVGACRRGASFKAAFDTLDQVRVQAVCDIHAEGLDEAAENLGAVEKYLEYEEMLDRAKIDAVLLGTPMHLHAPQAVQALQKDLHVLSEVTAAVSIDQCKDLVQATRTSKGVYMLAENCNYFRHNVAIREMVRQGLFGTPYYAEGEYLHELKQLNETTPWRRKWQTGIDGITYGTHSLGPILQWMANDRLVSLCCAGSGHHYRDPRGAEYAQDTSVMLGKMQQGGLVKIRVDMLSERPPVTTTFQLQGTEGCFESARGPGEKHRIWLASRSADPHTWLDLDELDEEFLPPAWRAAGEAAKEAGHGGSDFFVIQEFVDALQGNRPPEIGVHEAMDMTLPGLFSQQSIQNDGTWIEVPDSRLW
jgi:predicted dehydrogenase